MAGVFDVVAAVRFAPHGIVNVGGGVRVRVSRREIEGVLVMHDWPEGEVAGD